MEKKANKSTAKNDNLYFRSFKSDSTHTSKLKRRGANLSLCKKGDKHSSESESFQYNKDMSSLILHGRQHACHHGQQRREKANKSIAKKLITHFRGFNAIL